MPARHKWLDHGEATVAWELAARLVTTTTEDIRMNRPMSVARRLWLARQSSIITVNGAA